MDPEVLNEAKDFVSSAIDKAGAEGGGINYEVSDGCKSRWHAKALRTRWIDSLGLIGIASWEKDFRST